jgi:ADP-heptose:LPS heptosyltransferase
MEKLNFDCRKFRFDRPCEPHKATGVVCKDCQVYDPVDVKILIVKLDAAGDVLRTTSLLTPLKKIYPKSHVTWVTRKGSLDLLKHLPAIDRAVPVDTELSFLLLTEKFDLVLNPDSAPESARIATLAQASEKRGFAMSDRGYVVATGEPAQSWFETGINDLKKKQNTKTYQHWLLESLGFPVSEHPVLWTVAAEEKEWARQSLEGHFGDLSGLKFVGLNTGASGRWKYKKWTIEGYEHLTKMLIEDDPSIRVLLYGGADEAVRNDRIAKVSPQKVFDTGSSNSLRQFGALVSMCDLLVTGDTLALHLGAALKKPVIALFGPTSFHEIELYGVGEKIYESLPCLVCYLNDCTVQPNCMDSISSQRLFAAVKRWMPAAAPRVNGNPN